MQICGKLIDSLDKVVAVGGIEIVKLMKTVERFGVALCLGIVRDIDIPPRAVKVYAIPSVGGTANKGVAVHIGAGDILTAAHGGKEAGKVIAESAFRPQGIADIEVLKDGIFFVVVCNIVLYPSVYCLHLFLVGVGVLAKSVGEVAQLGIPHCWAAVVGVVVRIEELNGYVRGVNKHSGQNYADQNFCQPRLLALGYAGDEEVHESDAGSQEQHKPKWAAGVEGIEDAKQSNCYKCGVCNCPSEF